MRVLWALLFSSVLFGCAGEVTRMQAVSKPLPNGASFYVPVCPDGKHDGHQQVASGLMTSQLLSAELKTRALRVERGDQEEDRLTAVMSARNLNIQYVAFPSILDWQDDATPMASVPDKVKVRIDIIDVASADVIDVAVLERQTSNMATTKVPPQKLLAAPLKDYVETLFQPEKKKESQRRFGKGKRSFFSEEGDASPTSDSGE